MALVVALVVESTLPSRLSRQTQISYRGVLLFSVDNALGDAASGTLLPQADYWGLL